MKSPNFDFSLNNNKRNKSLKQNPLEEGDKHISKNTIATIETSINESLDPGSFID